MAIFLALLSCLVFGEQMIISSGNLMEILIGNSRVTAQKSMPNCTVVSTVDEIDKLKNDTPLMLWSYSDFHHSTAVIAKKMDFLCTEFNENNTMNIAVFNVNSNREAALALDVHGVDVPEVSLFVERDIKIEFPANTNHAFRLSNYSQGIADLKKWCLQYVHPRRTVSSVTELLELISDNHEHLVVVLPPSENGKDHRILSVSYPDVIIAEFTKEFSKVYKPKYKLKNPSKNSAKTAAELLEEFDRDETWFQNMGAPGVFVIRNHHYYLAEDDDAYHPALESEKFQHEPPLYDTPQLLSTLVRKELQSNALSVHSDPSLLINTLKEAIITLAFPAIVELTTFDVDRIFADPRPKLIIGAEFSKQITEMYDTLFDASLDLRIRSVVMTASLDDYVRTKSSVTVSVLKAIGTRRDELPFIKIIQPRQGSVGFEIYCPDFDIRTMSAEKLLAFIESYENGELELCVRSEQPHDMEEHPPNEPEIFIGKTFYKEVYSENTDKDLFLVAYAPWCGHCKTFEPQVRKLKEYANQIPSLRVAKIDATANDLPGAPQIGGYPTIFFFPGGKRDSRPVEYRGARKAEDLLKWIATQATTPFAPADVIRSSIENKDTANGLNKKAQIRAILDEL